MKVLRYFARHYPYHSLLVLFCLLLAAAAEGLGLSSVLPLLGFALDGSAQVATSEPSQLESFLNGALARVGLEPTLGLLLSLFVGAFYLKAIILILAKRQEGFTVAHVATDLRLGLLRALLSARWGYYTRQPVGRAANAIATEADRGSLAFHFLALVASYTVQAVLYLGIALAVSWRATVLSAAAGLVTAILLNALVRMSGRAGRKQTKYLKSLLSRVTDTLQVVKLLKAMGREPLIFPLLERDTRRLNLALRRRVVSKEALRALQEPIVVSFIALIGGLLLVRVSMPTSELLLLVVLFFRTLTCVNQIQRRYQAMITEASALWSLQEMIDRAEHEEEPTPGIRKPVLTRGIVLDGVRVRYGDRDILDGLHLEVPAGQVTALIGASGVGKTTLADLITGLLRPDAGEVWIDDIPLEEIDLRRWRRMIGYVPQETLLLHATVAINVSLGDAEVTEDDVEEALRDAGAWDFVSQLPRGIHSSVGERGTLLSGGQRQCIAIARALAHGAQLLILDEATAALDGENAAAVWKAIERLRGRMTVFAISHEPTLMGIADRIYRIEGGRAVEVSGREIRAGALLGS